MIVPDLAAGDVHLWTVELMPDQADLPAAAALLGEDERARASNFVFERDRLLFTLGRAALRHILASYLGIPPIDVGVRSGRFGKPELSPPFDASDLQFNASGSGGLALVAVALGRAVGIDVERVRPMPDVDGVANLVLSAREHAVFAAAGAADKLTFFHGAWTRKEAYLKARGEGLMRSPSLLECGALLGECGEPIRDADDIGATERWRAEAWQPAPGYHAALVAEVPVDRIVRLQLSF